MLQEQVVQTIASLLTTQVDELLQAVLKALAVFTNRCNEQCALQVSNDALTPISNCILVQSFYLFLFFFPDSG